MFKPYLTVRAITQRCVWRLFADAGCSTSATSTRIPNRASTNIVRACCAIMWANLSIRPSSRHHILIQKVKIH